MTASLRETQQEEVENSLPTRVVLPEEELSVQQLQQLWTEQNLYINYLEEKLNSYTKEVDEKVKVESSKREHLLVMRLTAKEHEIQELAAQVAELKSSQLPTTAALRSTLLDPAVNLIIQKLTKECESLKKLAEDKQNELAAWKFTSDSATGKRLMAKCRQLYQENEDLGKMISSGRLAKLEGELALQKNLSEQMKQNQLEMDDFMSELDEDVEGMQSTILLLQQQLREAKDEISRLSSKDTNKDDLKDTNLKAESQEQDDKKDVKEEEDEEMEQDEEDKDMLEDSDDDRETIPDESSLKRKSVEESEEKEEEKEEMEEKEEKEETKESIDEMLKDEDETEENVENSKDEEYESETKKRRISDTEENCDS